MSVTVLERDRAGNGTSRVAAGMLAPVAEVEFGAAGGRLLELGLRSAEMWPAFASELESASGVQVELLRTGTLLVARDADDARELERQLDFRRSLGLAVRRLRPSEAREREPALAPTVRLALEVPEDHSVDPRAVLVALQAGVCGCRGAGARARRRWPRRAGRRATGASTGVVLARRRARGGCAGGARRGTVERADRRAAAAAPRVPVRPVKGQILRLRDPAGPGLLRRVLRFRGGYLVPRGDGRYVLGATVEERGFELAPTAGGVYELLRDAHELVPGVSELEIEELSVGLRPGTPDNAPAIGPGAVRGLIWATGHYRNGILLAPLTAELVVATLTGEGASGSLLAACAPDRFAQASSGSAPPPVEATLGALS